MGDAEFRSIFERANLSPLEVRNLTNRMSNLSAEQREEIVRRLSMHHSLTEDTISGIIDNVAVTEESKRPLRLTRRERKRRNIARTFRDIFDKINALPSEEDISEEEPVPMQVEDLTTIASSPLVETTDDLRSGDIDADTLVESTAQDIPEDDSRTVEPAEKKMRFEEPEPPTTPQSPAPLSRPLTPMTPSPSDILYPQGPPTPTLPQFDSESDEDTASDNFSPSPSQPATPKTPTDFFAESSDVPFPDDDMRPASVSPSIAADVATDIAADAGIGVPSSEPVDVQTMPSKSSVIDVETFPMIVSSEDPLTDVVNDRIRLDAEVDRYKSMNNMRKMLMKADPLETVRVQNLIDKVIRREKRSDKVLKLVKTMKENIGKLVDLRIADLVWHLPWRVMNLHKSQIICTNEVKCIAGQRLCSDDLSSCRSEADFDQSTLESAWSKIADSPRITRKTESELFRLISAHAKSEYVNYRCLKDVRGLSHYSRNCWFNAASMALISNSRVVDAMRRNAETKSDPLSSTDHYYKYMYEELLNYFSKGTPMRNSHLIALRRRLQACSTDVGTEQYLRVLDSWGYTTRSTNLFEAKHTPRDTTLIAANGPEFFIFVSDIKDREQSILDEYPIGAFTYRLYSIILHPPDHFITLFRCGNGWFLYDDVSYPQLIRYPSLASYRADKQGDLLKSWNAMVYVKKPADYK